MYSTEAVTQSCSIKKFLINFAKSTRTHLFQRLFLNKVAGLRPENFTKIKTLA